jgi:tRNA pseudouridine38-40 synthase
MRYAAVIAYDGTAYRGFQRQANAPTIQERVEAALARIAGQSLTVLGAGRTDAGVHATGQVIAFDLDWHHADESLRPALNANLPADIAVREVWRTQDSFHPRFDAISRSYEYRLYVAPVRDPLVNRMAWHLTTELDVASAQAASAWLIGTHDFNAFGRPPQGHNSVRTVLAVEWRHEAVGQHTFAITADGFLFRMVRTIVAALVQVGQKHMTSEDFRGILAARQRGLAPAPARGLTLVKVTYPAQTR